MKRLFLLLILFCWAPPLVLTPLASAAFIVWDGSENTDWNTGLNWQGDAVPGPTDLAGFDDNTSSNSCVVGEDAGVDVLGITLDNYTGTLDLGDTGEDIQIGTSGFLVIKGTVDFGDATVTVTGGDIDFNSANATVDMDSSTCTVSNGDFSYVNCGSFAGGNSTLIMKGTGDLFFKHNVSLYNLTIFVDATTAVPVGSGSICGVANILTVNGTLNVMEDTVLAGNVCSLAVGGAGSITGAGTLQFTASENGAGLTGFAPGASIDIANVLIYVPRPTGAFVGATWSCTTLFKVQNVVEAVTWTWAPSGTHIFNCPVQFENTKTGGALQISGSNDPSYVFRKDVALTETAGTVEWINPGTGTITFNGGNTQAVDLGDQTVEEITVNKTGSNRLTFGAGWTSDSFTFTDGSVDFGEQTVATTGDFSVAPGCTFATGGAGLDGAGITVGGNYTVTGSAGTDIDMTASAWDLDVTGGAHCRWVNVTNCDASAGSTIYAQRSVDGGSNQGFLFLVRPRHWPLRLVTPRRRALFRGVGAN